MRFFTLCTAILALAPAIAVAQVPYATSPDWVSFDEQVSTGAALVDLDRDGWMDLVVSNGNDMAKQRLVVYYNQGDGTLPESPDWASDDQAYNGHLDVADVNGDGWLDVAVAVLGSYDDVDPMAKLYLNNMGTLSTIPDWQTTEVGNAFACAFGDVNNDGRPDLALATGWAYEPPNAYVNTIYLNTDGALATTASWSSTDSDHLQGVLWADTDSDGWLDLIGIASGSQTRVYRNTGGTLTTGAAWQTTDSGNQDAIMAVSGDLDGDDVRDLVVTDNTQLGGSGLFRQYDGITPGHFEATFGWSYYGDQGSALALADIDADGHLDLATGSWWGPTRVFTNTGTGLPTSSDWVSTPTSVIEKIVFADIDRDGVQWVKETFASDEDHLFHFATQPVEHVLSVVSDGTPLPTSEYTFSRENGWVTVGKSPKATLEVIYTRSRDLDMAISNWDSSVGNYLYVNSREGHLFVDGFETGDVVAWSEGSSR